MHRVLLQNYIQIIGIIVGMLLFGALVSSAGTVTPTYSTHVQCVRVGFIRILVLARSQAAAPV
jgi:hypothetical protein